MRDGLAVVQDKFGIEVAEWFRNLPHRHYTEALELYGDEEMALAEKGKGRAWLERMYADEKFAVEVADTYVKSSARHSSSVAQVFDRRRMAGYPPDERLHPDFYRRKAARTFQALREERFHGGPPAPPPGLGARGDPSGGDGGDDTGRGTRAGGDDLFD